MNLKCRNLSVGLILLFLTILSIASCGSPSRALDSRASKSPAPATRGQIETGSKWLEISEKTTCEALAPARCMGRFGFSVSQDSRYRVGPGPNGERVEGVLSPEEFAKVNQDALDLAAAGPSAVSDPICVRTGGVPGIDDRVEVSLPDRSTVTVYDAQGVTRRTCYRGGEEIAQRLHSDLRVLMLKHYPIPFPSGSE